jgi:hypothetical protein
MAILAMADGWLSDIERQYLDLFAGQLQVSPEACAAIVDYATAIRDQKDAEVAKFLTEQVTALQLPREELRWFAGDVDIEGNTLVRIETDPVIDSPRRLRSGQRAIFTGTLKLNAPLIVDEGATLELRSVKLVGAAGAPIESRGVLKVNASTAEGDWGGFRLQGGRAAFLGCQFSGFGLRGKAPLIRAAQKAEIEVRDCRFTQNPEERFAATAVELADDAKATVTKCRFEHLVAEAGAALRLSGGAGVVVEQSEFKGLQATHGGAIAHFGSGPIEVLHCRFLQCRVAEAGGAIWRGGVDFPKTKFHEVNGSGRLLLLDETVRAKLPEFKVPEGVAVPEIQLQLINCQFVECQAGKSGGGIEFAGKASLITLTDVVFDRCVAGGSSGGGVSQPGDDACLVAWRTRFLGCQANGRNGGGLYGRRVALHQVRAEDCICSELGGGIRSDWLTAIDVDFLRCCANEGGAVHSNYVYIRGARFHDNQARLHGGALYLSQGTILNAEFWRCRAQALGGAFYNQGSGDCEFDACFFQDCQANEEGHAGYYLFGSPVGTKIFIRNSSADSPRDFVLDDNTHNHSRLFQNCTFRRTD